VTVTGAALLAGLSRARPNAPAVVAARGTLTYAELGTAVHTVAGALEDLPASPPPAVALVLEQGWEYAAGLLGAFATGAVVVPIDPAASRVARWGLIMDYGIRLVLTQSWLEERLVWPPQVRCIAIDRVCANPSGPSPGPFPGPTRGAEVVLPASRPGAGAVALSHRGLFDVARGIGARFGVRSGDRVLSLAAPASDLALTDTLATLLAGATLVVPDDVDLRHPPGWAELIARERVTVWCSPPPLASRLTEMLRSAGEPLPGTLRMVLLTRPRTTSALLEHLVALARHPIEFGVLDGVAEAGVLSLAAWIAPPARTQGFLPSGVPLPGQSALVLDESLAPCPPSVAGRLHLGGTAVGRAWAPSGAHDERLTTIGSHAARGMVRTGLIARMDDSSAVQVVADQSPGPGPTPAAAAAARRERRRARRPDGDRADAGAGAAPGLPADGLFPASFLQRELFERARTAPASRLVRAVRLTGVIDRARLQAAVAEVTSSFEMLHSRPVQRDGVLWFQTAVEPPKLAVVSLGGSGASERENLAVTALLEERRRPVDLSRGPLVGFLALPVADNDLVLGVSAHELALDPRGLYGVLGALLQSYLGRFRVQTFPSCAEALAIDPLGDAAAVAARRSWWERRLTRWTAARLQPVPPARAELVTYRIAGETWRQLAEVSAPVGGNAALAVVALLTWGLRAEHPDRPLVLATTLDLREMWGLGQVIAPLTDRLIFEVDLRSLAEPTFEKLLVRVQAGLLDAAARYLPHAELARRQPPDAPLDALPDCFVHYCPAGPTSAATRGEATLAERDLSIELFAETMLAAAAAADEGAGDGAVQAQSEAPALVVHATEDRDDMVLHIRGGPRTPGDVLTRLRDSLAATVRSIVEDPGRPLSP
jgi:hypothetical protein